ncbi:nucleotide exchange factor GrpE [Dongia sedimenti]|uniref:Protein GrpE n=1 Tax=Dongia sedimenti TaxID=3064282 RepID=A0ABU0YN67_9PROT|nr:nucleotide exchange factor GrpE [Rhodospirillaceae bacterium R-7]
MMTDDKNEDGLPEDTFAADPEATGEDALAAARAEAAQLKDQLLRAMAETENTRRRAQRDRDDAQKYGITNFAREVLSVADNLRRALEAIPSETLQSDEALKTLYDGVAATERQLEAALGKQQIQRIWPEGERFDSNFHQAMFEVPDSGKPAGTVVQVLQAGYKIHDRLLRPALVGVAKGGAAANDAAAPGGNVDTTA